MFGGTVTKICSSKVKSANASGDNTPNPVSWDDINCSAQYDPACGTSVVQITGISGSIDIHLETYTGPPGYATNFNYSYYYKVSNSSFSPIACYGTPYGFYEDYQFYGYSICSQFNSAPVPITVSNGQYVSFVFDGNTLDIMVKVVNRSDGYSVIDTFMVYLDSSCFLTSALVYHMGLEDNGPELSAMRRLRDHYRYVPGYDAILAEYSQVSQQIISNIETSGNTDSEYGYIHSVVSSVVDAVAQGEWQQAHDLYMAMYSDLKSRYANS